MTASPAIDAFFRHAGATTSEATAPLEAQKIQAAQAGDMHAFEWLVRRHEDRVHGFCCRWLRCPQDAREVCQDVFVRAWQALPEFEGRSQLSTWLFQIALNLCRDRAKSRASRQKDSTITLDEVEQPPLCPQASPDANAELQSELEKLHRGLAALPENLRLVLQLTSMEGLSQEQCAQVLDCSVRAVEGRVYRARQALLDWWHEQG